MCNVVVVRPGATLFDEQERIKGSLDMPLSNAGVEQVQRTACALEQIPISMVYCGPCESAQSTAQEIAQHVHAKWKVIDCFKNVDHGLWQGKLIDEVKRQQPKLYRQVQDNPRGFCPPGGESMDEAEARIEKILAKLCKRHARETIAVVIPEPLASLVANRLKETDFEDVWQAEQDNGTWEVIDAETHQQLAAACASNADLAAAPTPSNVQTSQQPNSSETRIAREYRPAGFGTQFAT
jgi:phosphoserine phosphatase